MVSMQPINRVSADGKLMSDESRVTMELLPIRCFIHQSTLRVMRDFFFGNLENSTNKNEDECADSCPAETFFQVFKVKSTKLKVNYTPQACDTSALKEGAVVELINIFPIQDMIIQLKAVEMRNLTGWGSVFREILSKWIDDVASSQIHKFVTRTSAIQPFATIGDGMKDFLFIPLEEYNNHGDVKRGIKRGTSKLIGSVAGEALNITAKLSRLAAKALMSQNNQRSQTELNNHANKRNSSDTLEHLSRGLRDINTKLIHIPYREYQKTGATGAVKSVVKGLPVVICAPLENVSIAISDAADSARVRLRPDLREEQEASRRGLDFDI